MHRLPNQQTVRRFRMAAMLLLCKRLLVIGLPVFLVYSLIIVDHDLTHVGLAMMGVSVLLAIFLWALVNRLRCPLCLGLPLAISGSVKNRRALRLLGSYRFRVAVTILTKGHFRCPDCGEFTSVEVRRRRYR